MKGNEASSSPRTKPISSGSQERLEPTSWILRQENKSSFPRDIFLLRFFAVSVFLFSFVFMFFFFQGEERVVRFMLFNRIADTEMC